MRVVVCGDVHIGAVFGLGGPNGSGGNTRVDDFKNSLSHIVDYCIDNDVDVFVQTGDLFESRNPTPEHMHIADSFLKKLSSSGISSIVIMGNHDYRRNGSEFSSSISSLASNEYANVRMVLDPEVIRIDRGTDDSINILLSPYRDKRMYQSRTTSDSSKMYDKHMLELLGAIDNDHPTIAVGHNFYYEGSYNDFGGAEILTNISSFKSCDLVAMGHHHSFRIVQDKHPIAIYTGSMEKINFGDKDLDKYFIDYNSLNKKILFKKIPSRQLHDSEINMLDVPITDVDSFLEKKMSETEVMDKIVRMKIVIKESMSAAISKSYIEKKLYSMGAFFVSKVIVEPVSQRIVRDLSVLSHKDHSLMFEEFVKLQGFEEKLEAELISESKNIMGELDASS
jgi:exonuclease SbcD